MSDAPTPIASADVPTSYPPTSSDLDKMDSIPVVNTQPLSPPPPSVLYRPSTETGTSLPVFQTPNPEKSRSSDQSRGGLSMSGSTAVSDNSEFVGYLRTASPDPTDKVVTPTPKRGIVPPALETPDANSHENKVVSPIMKTPEVELAHTWFPPGLVNNVRPDDLEAYKRGGSEWRYYETIEGRERLQKGDMKGLDAGKPFEWNADGKEGDFTNEKDELKSGSRPIGTEEAEEIRWRRMNYWLQVGGAWYPKMHLKKYQEDYRGIHIKLPEDYVQDLPNWRRLEAKHQNMYTGSKPSIPPISIQKMVSQNDTGRSWPGSSGTGSEDSPGVDSESGRGSELESSSRSPEHRRSRLRGRGLESSTSVKPPSNKRRCKRMPMVCKDELILKVPRLLLITLDMAMRSEVGRMLSPLKKDHSCVTDHVIIASFLLQERDKGPYSFFYPWICMMPSTYKYMPLYLTQSGVGTWLKGAFECVSSIFSQQRLFQNDYRMLCTLVPSYRKWTLHDFVWARFAVISRIFGLMIHGQKTTALVPFADMMNHNRPSGTKWAFDDSMDSFTLTALRGLFAGESVAENYGKKDNVRFFCNYGFVWSDNEESNLIVNFDASMALTFGGRVTRPSRLTQKLVASEGKKIEDVSMGVEGCTYHALDAFSNNCLCCGWVDGQNGHIHPCSCGVRNTTDGLCSLSARFLGPLAQTVDGVQHLCKCSQKQNSAGSGGVQCDEMCMFESARTHSHSAFESIFAAVCDPRILGNPLDSTTDTNSSLNGSLSSAQRLEMWKMQYSALHSGMHCRECAANLERVHSLRRSFNMRRYYGFDRSFRGGSGLCLMHSILMRNAHQAERAGRLESDYDDDIGQSMPSPFEKSDRSWLGQKDDAKDSAITYETLDSRVGSRTGGDMVMYGSHEEGFLAEHMGDSLLRRLRTSLLSDNGVVRFSIIQGDGEVDQLDIEPTGHGPDFRVAMGMHARMMMTMLGIVGGGPPQQFFDGSNDANSGPQIHIVSDEEDGGPAPPPPRPPRPVSPIRDLSQSDEEVDFVGVSPSHRSPFSPPDDAEPSQHGLISHVNIEVESEPDLLTSSTNASVRMGQLLKYGFINSWTHSEGALYGGLSEAFWRGLRLLFSNAQADSRRRASSNTHGKSPGDFNGLNSFGGLKSIGAVLARLAGKQVECSADMTREFQTITLSRILVAQYWAVVDEYVQRVQSKHRRSLYAEVTLHAVRRPGASSAQLYLLPSPGSLPQDSPDAKQQSVISTAGRQREAAQSVLQRAMQFSDGCTCRNIGVQRGSMVGETQRWVDRELKLADAPCRDVGITYSYNPILCGGIASMINTARTFRVSTTPSLCSPMSQHVFWGSTSSISARKLWGLKMKCVRRAADRFDYLLWLGDRMRYEWSSLDHVLSSTYRFQQFLRSGENTGTCGLCGCQGGCQQESASDPVSLSHSSPRNTKSVGGGRAKRSRSVRVTLPHICQVQDSYGKLTASDDDSASADSQSASCFVEESQYTVQLPVFGCMLSYEEYLNTYPLRPRIASLSEQDAKVTCACGCVCRSHDHGRPDGTPDGPFQMHPRQFYLVDTAREPRCLCIAPNTNGVSNAPMSDGNCCYGWLGYYREFANRFHLRGERSCRCRHSSSDKQSSSSSPDRRWDAYTGNSAGEEVSSDASDSSLDEDWTEVLLESDNPERKRRRDRTAVVEHSAYTLNRMRAHVVNVCHAAKLMSSVFQALARKSETGFRKSKRRSERSYVVGGSTSLPMRHSEVPLAVAYARDAAQVAVKLDGSLNHGHMADFAIRFSPSGGLSLELLGFLRLYHASVKEMLAVRNYAVAHDGLEVVLDGLSSEEDEHKGDQQKPPTAQNAAPGSVTSVGFTVAPFLRFFRPVSVLNEYAALLHYVQLVRNRLDAFTTKYSEDVVLLSSHLLSRPENSLFSMCVRFRMELKKMLLCHAYTCIRGIRSLQRALARVEWTCVLPSHDQLAAEWAFLKKMRRKKKNT